MTIATYRQMMLPPRGAVTRADVSGARLCLIANALVPRVLYQANMWQTHDETQQNNATGNSQALRRKQTR